jgi:hypothetical protein
MYALSVENVRQWMAWNNKWTPNSIAVRCPSCRTLATFTLRDYSLDQLRNTIRASSDCPACRATIRLWVLDPGVPPKERNKTYRELCVCPTLSNNLEPMNGADKIPPEIRRE